MKTSRASNRNKRRQRVMPLIQIENQVRKCYREFNRYVNRLDDEFNRLFLVIEKTSRRAAVVQRGSPGKVRKKAGRR